MLLLRRTTACRLKIELNKAANEARDQIDNIHNQAKAAVRAWADPAGSNVDSSDLELLKGSFKLSAKDIHELLVRHQNSGIMVNAIAEYAAKNGVVPNYTPNVGDKLYIYEQFTKSAHRLVSDIVHFIGIGDNAISLRMWAEPGNISQRAELVLYGLREDTWERTPKDAKPAQGFSFNFKPLSGR